MRLDQSPALPPAQQCFVALVRTDYVTRTIPLSEPHYHFLQAMADGGGVEDGIEAAAHLWRWGRTVRRSWHAPDGDRRRWIDWGFFIARE